MVVKSHRRHRRAARGPGRGPVAEQRGYLGDGEGINVSLGFSEPDRLTDQLDEYEAFEFFRLPVTRTEVENVYEQFLDDSDKHFTITP